MSMQDVDWDRLDKRKFFAVGLGLFTGVTTCLYPLTVIKTRQMASSHTSPGIAGAWHTARTVAATNGIPGFYRGFATVIFATIPVRMVYMSALEMTKTATAKLGAQLDLAPTTQATVANFCGGAAASLSSQCLIVPVDVVTQRMMVHGMDTGASSTAAGSSHSTVSTSGNASASTSRPAAAVASVDAAAHQRNYSSSTATTSRTATTTTSSSSSSFSAPAKPQIGSMQQAQQGARTLRSGTGPAALLIQRRTSSSTASSSSGAGTAQMPPMSGLQMARLIVRQEGVQGLYRGFLPSISTYVPSSAVWWGMYALYQRLISAQLRPSSTGTKPSTGEAVAVQTSAAMLSGLTTGFLITPLDLVKTRMQVAARDGQGRTPTWAGTLRTVLSEPAGVKGLFKGCAPRMLSSCLWGTAMLSVYETLVRICVKPPGDES